MPQVFSKDTAIVLRRTDYAEADRIITVLTRQHGRIELIAKGCRKSGSKLAGGIEPFTVNQISWLHSKNGKLHTLRSARSEKVYGNIMKDYDILTVAYELLGLTEKTTRHNTEQGVFELSQTMFEQIDLGMDILTIKVWFYLNILQINGHQPDLSKDSDDRPLRENLNYVFDSEEGSLRASTHGKITANHIKALRVLQQRKPSQALQISGLMELTPDLLGPVQSLYNYYL